MRSITEKKREKWKNFVQYDIIDDDMKEIADDSMVFWLRQRKEELREILEFIESKKKEHKSSDAKNEIHSMQEFGYTIAMENVETFLKEKLK